MPQIKESKYIKFVKEYKPGRKTPIVSIYNKRDNFPVGQIQWWGAWRKYVFMPESEMIFDTGCLTEIITYINEDLKNG